VTQDIHIVAVGARTPLGFNADSSIAAVRAGISGVSEHPFIVDQKVEPVRMALDFELDPGLMGPERLILLAATALEEICHKLQPVWTNHRKIPIFLGLPEERPGWTEEHKQTVRDGLRSQPMPVDFEPFELLPYGHASGLIALDTACKQIRTGRAEVCIVAGVDSYLDLKTLEWLDENKQLATSYHRGAFFPGEGAGAIAVASDALVRRFRLESLAVIRGIGIATETKKIKTDTVCLGEGLTESVKKAVMPLRLPQEAVDGIICDINGERYRSEEWGFVILRLPDAMVDPTDYDLPASCWGDMGAASAPLFLAIAVTAGKRKWAKGKRYLIWNSSEGGQRAAAVLELNIQPNGAL
jgi:3-oxoacyl-[acyl-carrier-protein] synthase-1